MMAKSKGVIAIPRTTNIEAIRTLIRVASSRDHKRVFVDLANPSVTHSAPRERREDQVGGSPS